MGRYSLDNYEQYETLCVRPGWHKTPPVNEGYGQADPFPACEPLIHIRDREALLRARESGTSFALLIEPESDGLLNTAQMMAEQALQRHWLRRPVYARLNTPPDEEMTEALWAWHIRACNLAGLSGCDLQLRRITCPRAISSAGVIPLRLWLMNAGPSPLYGEHRIMLRLHGGGRSFDITLSADPSIFLKTGDIIYNEMVQLPTMPAGDYTLMLCILRSEGNPLLLNIDRQVEDGCYSLDSVTVDDQPRLELSTIWDRYYPEGYYPLEDPKEPQAE